MAQPDDLLEAYPRQLAWLKHLDILIQELQEAGQYLSAKEQEALIKRVENYALLEARKFDIKRTKLHGTLEDYVIKTLASVERGVVFSHLDLIGDDFCWSPARVQTALKYIDWGGNHDVCSLFVFRKRAWIKPILDRVDLPRSKKSSDEALRDILLYGYTLFEGGHSRLTLDTWQKNLIYVEETAKRLNLPLGRNLQGEPIIVYHPDSLRRPERSSW